MLGRILWILGLLLVVGGPAFGCAMMRIGSPALVDTVRDAKREAVEALQRIDGLPQGGGRPVRVDEPYSDRGA